MTVLVDDAISQPDRAPRPAPDDAMIRGGGEVGALLRSIDWSTTSVGPSATWPSSLRTILRVMLGSRYAMWLGWGPELAFFYNDAYRQQTLANKHPWALGRPFREVWGEIFEDLRPRVEHVLTTGEATFDEGLLLYLERSGYTEETYHTFSYSPMPDDAGATAGLFCVVIEETERVIGERRIRLQRDFAARLGHTKTTGEVLAALCEVLTKDCLDLPFSLVYALDDDGTRARRVCSTHIADDHPAAPAVIALDDPAAPWSLGSLRPEDGPRMVDLEASIAWPSGPRPNSPTCALVVPIARQGHARADTVFIVGMNPYRPVDDAMRSFVALFAGQLAAGLASARAFEEEKRRAEALAELDRAKTAFFANVSHEFRTPLTLLLGPIEDLLGEPSLEPEHRALLETAERNALRLLKLVNTLLDFARIEAGRVDATFESTDLGAYTADLASAFRAAVEKAGLRLEVDVPATSSAALVDRTMWEKIVLNLLSNALKHTFEGAITVGLRALEDRFELVVRDTGIGIPADEVPRLFERFHRVRGARSRTHEGTGIGLALVRELVALHGGTIAVASVVGQGTEFRVSVPAGTAHLPAERIGAARTLASTSVGAAPFVQEALRWLPAADAGDDAQRPGKSPANRAPVTAIGPARIVLADDNADMRAYIGRLLSDHGWQVEAVADGAAALETVRANPPDLVLSDVMMPGLDGFALLRALRADAATREVPLVLLSARAGEEAVAEGLSAGADDYIVKPFTARDLVVRVTARLSAARAAREASDQRTNLYRHFMQAPFPVAIVRGPNHVVELANDAILTAWGKRADSVGRPLAEALPELHDQPFLGLLDRVFATGAAYEGRGALARLPTGPDGALEDAYFNFVYAPLLGTRGAVEGVLICAFDVTNQVQSAQRVDAARAEAERANRLKDEFLATMSHELRTPLNAILGWTRMLRGGTLAESKRARALETIERNARTQVALIEDVLDVARIESGKLRLSIGPVEMVSVVEAALDTARPAAEAKGVRLQVLLDPDAGTTTGDPNRLQQVVWNLLSNAVKFTPAGGRVQVRLQREKSHVEIVVSDNGQGIPTSFLPYVFERFRQADATITRTHGGLGLGLSIVRHLVELHGGTIRAESEGPGRGATFTVHLPVAPDLALPSERVTTGRSDERLSCPPGLRGLSVLVVDDEPDARELLQSVLEQCESRVRTASSVAEALERFREETPDVIVSDIGMPGEDGYALIRRVRALSVEAGSRTPAVALTAYARTEDRTRALMEGFTNHIGKPVDPQELLAVLAAAMATRLRG